MAQQIRRTSFTWHPDRESRADIWIRITAHVQQALDRIHAEYILTSWTGGSLAVALIPSTLATKSSSRQWSRARPSGSWPASLGSPTSVCRRSCRTDLRWLTRDGPDQLRGEDRHPAQHGPPSDRQVDTPVPRTMKMMSDP